MGAPTIVVTGPDSGGTAAWLFTSSQVRLAGGHPVRVTPSRSAPHSFDGLILGGGEDVLVETYGENTLPETPPDGQREPSLRQRVKQYAIAAVTRLLRGPSAQTRVSRDPSEVALLERADELGVPVLGICRGAQLMNVFHGGKLHRSLASFYEESPVPWTVLPTKPIDVTPRSLLDSVLGSGPVIVNSLHHMAISDLGAGLEVVARDELGVVQAVERNDRSFYIGVQWHPEYLPQKSEQRRIFSTLVEHARIRPRAIG